MLYDYLIIGQGLAGTHVAWQALQRGEKPLIVDEWRKGAASKAAGGLVNPITGRRLTKSWKADELIPFAKATYQAQERFCSGRFFYPMDIVRLFKDASQRQQWVDKRRLNPEYSKYILKEEVPAKIANCYQAEHGGLVFGQAGFLEPVTFLNYFRDYLHRNGMLVTAPFTYADLKVYKGWVEWQGFKARQLIACEGWGLSENPYFRELPLKAVKGQVLTVDAPELPGEQLVNKGLWVIPMGGSQYRIGASYEHDLSTIEPSEEAYETLIGQVEGLLKVPYQVINRQFGIRPAMKDGQPVVGWHPAYPQLGILNGLGSKGVLQAPFLAAKLLASLDQANGLMPEVNINRHL